MQACRPLLFYVVQIASNFFNSDVEDMPVLGVIRTHVVRIVYLSLIVCLMLQTEQNRICQAGILGVEDSWKPNVMRH